MGLRRLVSRETQEGRGRGTSCRSLFAPETGSSAQSYWGPRQSGMRVCVELGPMTGLASSRIRARLGLKSQEPWAWTLSHTGRAI